MFEGGPTQVGMVFDWRQLAGRPTYDWTAPKDFKGYKGWQGEGEDGTVDPAVLVKWNLDNVWLDVGNSPAEKVLDHESILRFKQNPNGTNEAVLSEGGEGINVEAAIEHWDWSHEHDSHRSLVLIFTWALTVPLDIILLVFLVRRPTHMLDHALTFHLLNLLITTFYVGSVPTSLLWWLTMLVHAAVVIVWSEQLAIKREMGRGVGYSLVGDGGEGGGGGRKGGGEVVFDEQEEEGLLGARERGKRVGSRDYRVERIELRPL